MRFRHPASRQAATRGVSLMDHKKRPYRGWLAALGGLAAAGALAGYGIWSRQTSIDYLQQTADDAALTRVQVASPMPGPPTAALTLPGEVRAWNEAPIYGQVSGYISHWFKDYGAHVKAGDVLATIETPSLDAQFAVSKANLRAAQTQYNLAAETAKRFDALTTLAVTQQEKDDRNATAAADKAEVAAAQQTVNQYQAMIDFKKIVAPFDGVVTARRVNVGDFINAAGADASLNQTSQAPFSVADTHKLRVFVSVPQAYGGVLTPGSKADLTLPGEPGKKIPAHFLTTADAVSPSTRTIVTELVVDDEDGLWPGSYVNVNFTFPNDPKTLIIPSQALLFRAEGMQVALVDDQDRVRLKNVTLGRNLGLDVEIAAGLKTTDKIVANPSLGLLEGQQVKVVHAAKGYEPGQDSGGRTPALQAADHQSKPEVSPNPFASQDRNGATQAAAEKE
jgi:membrane fusion protein (multidrug efflux system)